MRKLIQIVILLLLAAVGSSMWILQQARQALEASMSIGQDPLRLNVSQGITLAEVADELKQKGVLENPRNLVWYARWNERDGQIKAGEYSVPAGTTPLRLLDLLIEGKVIQWSFTIIEGWTFRQLRDAIGENKHLVQTLGGVDDDTVMNRLGRTGSKPEGWFYPETYHFPSGTTDAEFLRRALNAMQQALDQEWADRDPNLPYQRPYDALILASIVERETGTAHERTKISGVFVRRLRKGMRLEADPTVIYGLGDAFDGNITHEHLKQRTPYNTYTRRGLPPTPIAMPSGAAVHAALHPEAGNELFFVAKGDGTHHFSETYEEHEKAVQQYQLKSKSADGSGTQ